MLKEKIRKFFTGIDISKEYPCIDHRLYMNEVKVQMRCNESLFDVTDHHLFLGYKPLIAGVYLYADTEALKVSLLFTHRNGTKLAEVQLKKLQSIPLDECFLILFTGLHADTFFLPFFNRTANGIIRMFRKKINGNVEMEGNEYQQVQSMYAVPRKISVISLGDENGCNMFPTDLHGNAGKNFYVDSLRKAGKACEQVLAYKKIVKADVAVSTRDDVFAMGKNHMKPVQPASSFSIEGYSEQFNLPLPKATVAYKELMLEKDVEIGIHRVLIFSLVNEVLIDNDEPVLSCTNHHYLQWRLDHSLPTEYC